MCLHSWGHSKGVLKVHQAKKAETLVVLKSNIKFKYAFPTGSWERGKS